MMDKSAARPIESSNAQRVCRLGGIDLRSKLIELKNLEKLLEIAARDAEKSIRDEYFWRAVEISAKIVSVSCDLLVAGLEERTGPVGKAVSTSYDVAKIIADALNNDLTLAKAVMYSTGVKLDAISYHLQSSGGGKANAIDKAKIVLELSYDLFNYFKDDKFLPSGTIGARRTVLAQIKRIQAQIRTAEYALMACSLQ
jgi:hypothetical protein